MGSLSMKPGDTIDSAWGCLSDEETKDHSSRKCEKTLKREEKIHKYLYTSLEPGCAHVVAFRYFSGYSPAGDALTPSPPLPLFLLVFYCFIGDVENQGGKSSGYAEYMITSEVHICL